MEQAPTIPNSIDRDSYEPAYAQLANIIRRQIADGQFRPGDQLPSESQFCRKYGISPMTVRRAINLLADEGTVSTEQGRGTFVKSIELSSASFDLKEFGKLFLKDSGGEFKFLDVRIVSANEKTARKLEISIGEPVIYICRLFSKENDPVFYHREYLIYDPTRPIVESEMDATSLKGLFSDTENKVLKCGQLKIEATLMTEEEANIFGYKLPAAAFYLEHLFYDFDNRPISWGWFIFPSDRLYFTTKIGLDLPD